jgi:hypothetical protein
LLLFITVVVVVNHPVDAFAPIVAVRPSSSFPTTTTCFAVEQTTESVVEAKDDDDDDDDDISLEKVESLGRGAAKVSIFLLESMNPNLTNEESPLDASKLLTHIFFILG